MRLMHIDSATPVSWRLSTLLSVCAVLFAWPSMADFDEKTATLLDSAIASDIRTEAEKARDKNRMPKETLEFFGLRSDMRVAEFFPGGGWYTKVLAPTVANKGEYLAVGGLGKAMGYGEILARLRDTALMKDISVIDVSGDLSTTDQRGLLDASKFDFGVKDLDMFLTFRNLHNLTPNARKAMYRAAYRALKSGGRFGAIDHTRRHMQGDSSELRRRLDPVQVIQEATSAGFKLVDYSTLHYHADDELRYEVGRRSVAGNTDRFTLLFEK